MTQWESYILFMIKHSIKYKPSNRKEVHRLQNSKLALGKEGEWVREYKRGTFYFFKNQNQIWQNNMGRVQDLY